MHVQQMKDEYNKSKHARLYGKYQDEWVTINMLLSNQTLNYMYTEKLDRPHD